MALLLRPDGLVSFGLGGPELGVPAQHVRRRTSRPARAAGLHSVPHAGESAGPESVWEALDLLGAERIGHGIAAAQDPALLARLRDDGIAARGLPDLQRVHPLGAVAGRSTRCRRSSRPAYR